MNNELARRAVACPGWRWLPGMLVTRDGARDVRIHGARPPRLIREGQEVAALPDLTDPATVGCLLALVREAWGFQAFVTLTSGGWHVLGFPWEPDLTSSSRLASGPTEAAALVAALEAAP